MGNIAISFIQAHQQYFIGIATGWAFAHIPAVVLAVFRLAMRIPWLRAAVIANPAQAKAVIDSIQAELDRDIDAEAASAKAAAPLPPTP
jgi:hypothetical protein